MEIISLGEDSCRVLQDWLWWGLGGQRGMLKEDTVTRKASALVKNSIFIQKSLKLEIFQTSISKINCGVFRQGIL